MRGRSNGLLGLIGVVLLLFAAVRLALPQTAGGVDALYIGLHAFAGILALVAYLSAGVENLRSVLGQRSTRYGASAVLASVFFVGILVSLNYLSTRYHRRFDLTEAGVFSLSPQSAQVVKNLEHDLLLQGFVEGGINPELKELFDSYRYASPKVSVEMIDPERQPDLAQKYQIASFNTVRIQYGDSTATVTQPSEETITNAIIKASRAAQQTVCIVEGHGEPDSADIEDPRGYAQARKALENENYQVKTLLLFSLEKVPDDCSALVVAGPAKPFQPQEMASIDQYLRRGGRAFFLLAPRQAAEFPSMLARWGVKLGDDIVVDQVVRLFQGPSLGLEPLVNTYDPTHEITRDLKQRTIFPMSRSVQADATATKGTRVTELVKTSASSWAESDVSGIFERQEATLDNADKKGPVSLGVAVAANLKDVGADKDGEARLVVFGSSEFANNRNFEGSFYNRDLFLNAVGWLVGQSDLLSIRPRDMKASRVRFSQQEGTVIFYLSVLLIPEALLIAGLAVWWRRE